MTYEALRGAAKTSASLHAYPTNRLDRDSDPLPQIVSSFLLFDCLTVVAGHFPLLVP